MAEGASLPFVSSNVETHHRKGKGLSTSLDANGY
jgi:hypothetical protein